MRGELCELETLQWWRRNPAAYVETIVYGLFLLVERRFAPPQERAGLLARRLECVPALLEQARANVDEPPAVFTSVARQVAAGGIQFLEETVPAFIRSAAAGGSGVEGPLAAAVERLREHESYLEDLAARSTGEFAVGESVFDFKLKNDHFLDVDGSVLLQIGEEAMADSEERLTALAAELAPGEPWPKVISRLKEDHPDSGSVVETYRGEMRRAREFVERTGIVPLPEDEELAVMETPVFDRATIPYAAYLPPAPFEEEQRGLFYVTPVDEGAPPERRKEQLRGHCLHAIPVTALHEGYPGHHLQMVTSNRVGSRVRKLVSNTVFVEGWALYCEELMREQGYYSDKRTLLIQLKDLLWRSARVVIDVKLHRGDLGFDEAVDFLIERAHLERVNAQVEVARYAMTPTQPMSYLMGKRAIMALRSAHCPGGVSGAELREFHRRLLAVGSVPPAVAESELSAGG